MKRRVIVVVVLVVLGLVSACSSKERSPPPPTPTAPADADPTRARRDVALAVSGHVLVLKSGPFPEYRDAIATVKHEPGIATVEPFVFATVAVSTVGRPNLHDVALKGVDPAGAVPAAMARYTTRGTFDVAGSSIVLGDGLAKKLGVRVGDELDVSGDGPAQRVKVAGIFHVVVENYDKQLGYVALPLLQTIAGRGDLVTGLEIRVTAIDQAPAIGRRVDRALGGPPYEVKDYVTLNAPLFDGP